MGGGFPSSCEGWHGRPLGKPVRRMRDYVDVLQQVFRTAGSSDAQGTPTATTELFAEQTRAHLGATVQPQSSEISIPYAGERSLGVRPWASALEPPPVQRPVVLAAVGPAVISPTAQIADGWFRWGFAPAMTPAFEP